MKILVISPVYSLAGVPLAQLRLAKSLVKFGYDVDLIYGCKKYKKIESDIVKVKDEMKKLGLQSKLYNPRIKRYEYFGKLYGSKKSPILALRESILDPAVEGVGRKHGGIVDINKLTRPL